MKKLLLLIAFLLVGSSWSLAQTEQSTAGPPNGLSEIEAYSIYLENYRSDTYKTALRYGRWIWKAMPEKIEGYSRFDLKKNLSRLISVYSGAAEQVEDPSLREAYVDTALMIFDKTFEKYPDDAINQYDWYIKRGRVIQTHSSVIDNASSRAAEGYYKAYQLRPEEFTKYGDGYYIKFMLQEFVADGKKDLALKIIKNTKPNAPQNLLSYYDKVREELFDSPEERITYLENQLKDSPDNEEILTKLRDLYQDQEMTKKAREVSEKLYKLNANYENTMAVADVSISDAEYDRAIKYLKEAMDKTSEDGQKAEIALKISSGYLNKEKLQSARRFARKASDYDSDWGKPYIQIADVYAQAVSQCTSDRKLTPEDKAVYWLVLDYLDKAEQVDPTTASEVERKYKSYEPVTPSQSEKFFWEPPLKDGEDFEIDSSLMKCYSWIGETTQVR